jgi:hypothetical protein
MTDRSRCWIVGTRCGGGGGGEVRQIGDLKTGVHWLEEGLFLGGPRDERCCRLQSLTAPTHVRSSRADRHSPFPQNRKEFPVVAFNTPTIRVRLCRAVDDPADAGPGNRPEADRPPYLIASFERHLESPSMIGFARENFQAAVDAKKARLAELRRQENGPAAADDDIITESTP